MCVCFLVLCEDQHECNRTSIRVMFGEECSLHIQNSAAAICIVEHRQQRKKSEKRLMKFRLKVDGNWMWNAFVQVPNDIEGFPSRRSRKTIEVYFFWKFKPFLW